MSNIFKEKDKSRPKLKRNNFDLSHFNNMTMRFGRIYPNLVMEVLPGDTVNVDASMGLNLMPMVYPVQTPMYVNQYFFYVRNRALYEDWMDFIHKTKDGLTPPYLKLQKGSVQASKILSTGSLGDYMGIPTINESVSEKSPFIAGVYNLFASPYAALSDLVDNWNWLFQNDSTQTFSLMGGDTVVGLSSDGKSYSYPADWDVFGSSLDAALQDYTTYEELSSLSGVYEKFIYRGAPKLELNDENNFHFYDSPTDTSSYYGNVLQRFYTPSSYLMHHNELDYPISQFVIPFTNSVDSWEPAEVPYDTELGTFTIGNTYFYSAIPGGEDEPIMDTYIEQWNSHSWLTSYLDFIDSNGYLYAHIPIKPKFKVHRHYLDSDFNDISLVQCSFVVDGDTWRLIKSHGRFIFDKNIYPIFRLVQNVNYIPFGSDLSDWSYNDVTLMPFPVLELHGSVIMTSVLSSSPFISDEPDKSPTIPISALPFRAVEACFNAYFRDQKNDPLIIDGQPEYNKYVRNMKGGADEEIYDFYNRYWEPDFLTSCLPSPQQGVAPLVGVSSNGTFTFEDEHGQQYTAHAVIGEDGETLTGIDVHSPDLPLGSLRALMQYVNHGLSINDFRNVNSLQRWLETNIRSGFKYRDLMRAHHGVDIRFDELNMPEYIGGFNTMIDVGKIVNSDAQGERPLGEFAGLGSAFGKNSHSSRCYCDEHGFIIGLVVASPVPVYSQNLPKFYTKHNTLDYYSHEFAKIGYQPVMYNEVTPINRYNESLTDATKSVFDTFGYQRPWYDYMSMCDEAHGDFRGNLRDFIMYRLFGQSPVLGKDFLTMHQSQMNDVFAETGDNDKIMGQFYFKITRKSQLLRHVTPSLE